MSKRIQLLITLAIALVWLINGLYCKLLGMVPRHELIVAAILGDGISYWATKAIGASEILMVIWVVSRIKPAWCALAQIVLVIVMNVIEAALVPDLLLFGYWNMLFAGLFVLFVATDAFLLPKIGKHPFPVEAFFAHSLVLTFALPKEKLQAFLPPSLSLDLYQDKWGFFTVALVDTRELRPKGFPKAMGNSFILAGYRLFVKYVNVEGKRLRGLYILRSETNKKKMEWLGNLFTQYSYVTSDISFQKEGSRLEVSSKKTGLYILAETGNEQASLPENSPFSDWKEARRFAGPLPFTFHEHQNEMLIVEGVRENWVPAPAQIISFHVPMLKELGLEGAVLANAFVIKDIPYWWKKGRMG